MKKFWWEIFSENSVGSFSRVATTVVLLFLLGWDTYLVYKNNSVPNLSDQALFLGVLYGVNKAASVASSFSTPPTNGKTAPPTDGKKLS